MMDLFSYAYPVTPGFKEHTTSREAAESVASRVPLLRSKCLSVLRSGPRTADEIADMIGESVLSIRPRISELYQLGKIEDSGERRANASGRRAKVWAVR